MVNKTVGSGGDYATLYDAWVWLTAQTPLLDNYTFTVISDINLGGSITNGPHLGGHTVYVTSGADYPFYIITCGANAINLYPSGKNELGNQTGSDDDSGTIDFSNLKVVGTGTTGIRLAQAGGFSQSYVWKIHECLITGSDEGIGFKYHSTHSYLIYNCKIYGCKTYGIGYTFTTTGPGVVGSKKIENTTVYLCGNSTNNYRAGIFLMSGSSGRWELKNVVVSESHLNGSGSADYRSDIGGIFSGNTITYCADSDGSLTGGTNNINNIVAADEFESLTPTDSKFLFLKDSAITKTEGFVNLFLPSTYTYTAEYESDQLGGTGTAPTLVTTDIAGVTYLDAAGNYPIGCHAPDATTTTVAAKKYGPDYGYEVVARMNIHVVKCADGSYKNYDDGNAYDQRICRFTMTVTAAVATALIAKFRNTDRGETITLSLGTDPVGFYPFGPDLGDVGDFTVRILSFRELPWGMQPYGHIPVEVEMVKVTAPAYSPGAGRTEGVTQIGTVTGLRWPDPGYTPQPDYSVKHVLARSGTPYVEDTGKGDDRYVSEFTLPCCTSNAALVAAYMTGTGRGNNIAIVPGANGYMFGATEQDGTGAGTYVARLILGDRNGTDLVMRHVDWDRWEIPLRFWMVSRS